MANGVEYCGVSFHIEKKILNYAIIHLELRYWVSVSINCFERERQDSSVIIILAQG